ncbi:MAG: DUF2298 domain-containing protein [Microthrixaceae bacterium]|nr:DUF2298 domain-containing protein [Microthrixaceae bacterium]
MAVVVPLWAAVAWGIVGFSATAVVLATVSAGLVGWGVPRHRREALALWRTHRRAILTVEAIVVVLFAAVLALRAAVPDLWFHPSAGRSPSRRRSSQRWPGPRRCPRPIRWYSGGAMNYYYGSWFSLAVPTRLLGIRPEVALNLAVATVASLVGAASWSVGVALGRLGRRGRTARRRGLLAGLLGVGSLLLVGNLDTRAGWSAGRSHWTGGRCRASTPPPPTSTSSPPGRCSSATSTLTCCRSRC